MSKRKRSAHHKPKLADLYDSDIGELSTDCLRRLVEENAIRYDPRGTDKEVMLRIRLIAAIRREIKRNRGNAAN